jgi:dihydropteroate synthase
MISISENNPFKKNYSLNVNGNILGFEQAKVMGILNITPDSFFDGGKYPSLKSALNMVEKMLSEGADIIDIGAMSSKPGAKEISESEEIERLRPILKEIKRLFPKAILSIDTYRSEVAKESIELGAHIINDISAGTLDANMFQTIGQLQVPYVMMHMKGTPSTMQNAPFYKNVVTEIFDFFFSRIQNLKELGVKDIIIDPGFGFGKTLAHNFKILKNLNYFCNLELPILAGISRKSMIYKVIETNANFALNGTTVANTIALLNGASILRVHDVKEAKEAIKIVDYMQKD